jgi:hypothetical protein
MSSQRRTPPRSRQATRAAAVPVVGPVTDCQTASAPAGITAASIDIEPELHWFAKRATDKLADYSPVIREIQAAGITSLAGIAAALNERGIPTASGQGTWQAVQVERLLGRL